MASGQFCTTRLYNIFAGNVEGKRAGERLWLFPVSGAFFVNGHHSLNQEAVGPSVNRDHNIWTTKEKNVPCRRRQAVRDQYFNCNIISYH